MLSLGDRPEAGNRKEGIGHQIHDFLGALGKSKISRNKLREDIDSLDAAIEGCKAMIQKLADDTATLTQEVS